MGVGGTSTETSGKPPPESGSKRLCHPAALLTEAIRDGICAVTGLRFGSVAPNPRAKRPGIHGRSSQPPPVRRDRSSHFPITRRPRLLNRTAEVLSPTRGYQLAAPTPARRTSLSHHDEPPGRADHTAPQSPDARHGVTRHSRCTRGTSRAGVVCAPRPDTRLQTEELQERRAVGKGKCWFEWLRERCQRHHEVAVLRQR